MLFLQTRPTCAPTGLGALAQADVRTLELLNAPPVKTTSPWVWVGIAATALVVVGAVVKHRRKKT